MCEVSEWYIVWVVIPVLTLSNTRWRVCVCNYMYVRKALILRQVTIHCLTMWRAVKQLRGRYRDSKMSGEKIATIDAQETLSVTESLKLCKKLLDHGWMSAQSGKVPWNDAMNTGIDGCMGLVTMSNERHFKICRGNPIYGSYCS